MLTKLPNILTLSRIAAIPVIVVLLLFFKGPVSDWTAFGIFAAAAITDFFDGYIARAWQQQSTFGRFLDPIADKLVVAAVLLTLVGDSRIAGIHVLAAVIIMMREILVSGLREFLGQVRVSVPVTKLAKWKTTIQLLAIGILIVGPSGPQFGPFSTAEIGLAGLWGAALLTLVTGYDYFTAGMRQIAESDAREAGGGSGEGGQSG